ncbi:hypothetical protein EDD29_7282 [Actinocorallia herbida]|uniref:RNA polymerase alpha subunit n=1 Tax=Actinocorallia herbida TaxID=58109 RepID=A0A3N1D7R2_9ACTN|nr:hypothetical protein [Actinocorallia herbida]ROO89583.1 hypothetical protein EDD29_7282 [Actinocorallia herbida]
MTSPSEAVRLITARLTAFESTLLNRIGTVERKLETRLAAIETVLREHAPERDLGCGQGPDGEHVLTSTCPLTCLQPPVLPARPYNALVSGCCFSVIGDVITASQAGELTELRNMGPISAERVESVLRTAGLLPRVES